MKKVVLILLLSSVCLYSFTGYWEQRHPELNGEVPGPREGAYMSSIGERKVLMLNGLGGGNPYYFNGTWIYDYDVDKWTQIQCDSQPNTDHNDPTIQTICNMSKNVIMMNAFEFSYRTSNGFDVYIPKSWLFHLDSLNWYKLNGNYLAWEKNINIGEKKIISYDYRIDTISGMEIGYGLTKKIEIELTNPITNSIISMDTLIDEGKGNYGPNKASEVTNGISFYTSLFNEDLLNDKMPVLFFPLIDKKHYAVKKTTLPFMYLDTLDWSWKDIPRDFEIANKNAYNHKLYPYSNLINDVIFQYTYEDTSYFYYYDTTEKMMKIESITFLNECPINERPNGYNKMIKIKNRTAMLFTGKFKTGISETWIFHLTDTTDIVDSDTQGTGHIFFVGDNNYFLKDIEDAELFDIMGKSLGKFYNYSIIDLNKYVVGSYLLRYTTDGKKYKTYNLIRK